MKWQDSRESSNVEDRRGDDGGGVPGGGSRMSVRLPGGRGGGLSIGAVLVVLVISWLTGINPLTLLSSLDNGSSVTDQGGSPGTATSGPTGAPNDEAGKFVAAVLGDTEDTWTTIFKASGKSYTDPILVLYSGQTASACGFASAAVGPFYCPGDQKLYIDLDFYAQLRDQFHAPGDFAMAYVIAHEVGHHVQNLLGILPKVDRMRGQADEAQANQLSIRLELQADCLAGVWAKAADQKGLVEVGDVDEALRAAAAVGDDAIQMRTRGYVVPESFNHGTSDQRSRWFKRGLGAGAMDACDTFGAAQL